MDVQTLELLSDIRSALYILIGLVVLSVIANWIRTGLAARHMIKSKLEEIFNRTASEHYEKGEYDLLLDHCNSRIQERPNHAYAHWYKGKVLFQKKEYEQARECFEKLCRIEPSWMDDHVKPYLQKIDAALNKSA